MGWRSGAAGRTGSSRWPCCPWSWQGPCSPSIASCVVGFGPGARLPGGGRCSCCPRSGCCRTRCSTFSTPTACGSWRRSPGSGSTGTRSSSWIRGSGSRFPLEYSSRSAGRGSASPNPERPARVALLLTAAYAVSMMLSGVVGRVAAARSVAGSERRMVGPVPLNPFRRQLVLDFGDAYRYGSVEFLPRPAVEVARGDDSEGRGRSARARGGGDGAGEEVSVVVALSDLPRGARGGRRRPRRAAGRPLSAVPRQLGLDRHPAARRAGRRRSGHSMRRDKAR